MNAEVFRATPRVGLTTPRPAGPMRSRVSRRTHRWVSVIFTATVALNFAVMAFRPPPPWITYAPLPPLLFLLITGLIMLVSPWIAGLRRPEKAISASG